MRRCLHKIAPALRPEAADHWVDHLSRHTSGLPDYFEWGRVEPPKKKAWYGEPRTRWPSSRGGSSFKRLELLGAEGYEYSNTGYMVLAALVERASGLSFGGFLAKVLLKPAGTKTAGAHKSRASPVCRRRSGTPARTTRGRPRGPRRPRRGSSGAAGACGRASTTSRRGDARSARGSGSRTTVARGRVSCRGRRARGPASPWAGRLTYYLKTTRCRSVPLGVVGGLRDVPRPRRGARRP